MNKLEQIEAKKLKPFECDDHVSIKVDYQVEESSVVGSGKNKRTETKNIDKTFKSEGKILKIDGDSIHVKAGFDKSPPFILSDIIKSEYLNNEKVFILDKKYINHTFKECGVNPFSKRLPRIDFYNKEIWSILYSIGFDCDTKSFREGHNSWNSMNFNPYIILQNGDVEHYQRGLVWNLEQKQLLIDSIYNGIEIGKIVIKVNSFDKMDHSKKYLGEAYGYDCVDGKQRLNAIVSFIKNEFTDSYGNYYDDLSEAAQRRFKSFDRIAYAQIPENFDDVSIIETFLNLNFTGTPMSKEHIEYVQNIRNKF